MILCAGFGTRLRPLTEELPKPLVWVGDRPLFLHAVERLARRGIERVVVNTHHLPESFRDVAASAPIPVSIVHEPAILGTAGGIAGARAELGPGGALVVNGDIEVDASPEALRQAAVGADAALLVRGGRAPGEGSVGLSAEGSVVRLRQQRFGEEAEGADYLGVAHLEPALRDHLPAEGCLVGDALIPCLGRGGRVTAVRFDGPWADLGALDAYVDANLRWLGDRSHHVGAGARVATGVELVRSVVGAGAIVEGAGRLEACVVWPGARALAPATRQVVTPNHVVTIDR